MNSKSRLIFFNKPCGVLTQFSDDQGRPTLKDWIPVPGIYPAGRLDSDSEGLVVLTDSGEWQTRIADPRHKLPKTYWAQVENVPEEKSLALMRKGLDLGDFVSASCRVKRIPEPVNLWPRNPPIRFRAVIPTCWLEIVLREGKNRQVRRMTAKIGYPTLRLIRWAVGPWTLDGLNPGEWRDATPEERKAVETPRAGNNPLGRSSGDQRRSAQAQPRETVARLRHPKGRG